MKTLTTLLERISASLGRDTVAKDSVISAMQEVLGFALPAKDIHINGVTLEVTATPVRKSAIKLKESEVLRAINTRVTTQLTKVFYK